MIKLIVTDGKCSFRISGADVEDTEKVTEPEG